MRDSFRFVKVRHNKLSFTKTGSDYLIERTREELFQDVFRAYSVSLNWGYHDGYAEHLEIQKTFGFVLYLLLRYGDEERAESFYGSKLLKAFPHILHSFDGEQDRQERSAYSCLSIRCFQRFLNWFNLITIVGKVDFSIDKDHINFKNDQLKNVFELDKSKFLFKKEGFKA